jgi:hypothetical protein
MLGARESTMGKPYEIPAVPVKPPQTYEAGFAFGKRAATENLAKYGRAFVERGEVELAANTSRESSAFDTGYLDGYRAGMAGK